MTFIERQAELSLLLLNDAALLDASLLTGETTQVIQLGATNLTMLVDGNVVDKRRLERENTLNADVVTDLANGEALLVTLASDLDNHTTVLLDTLLVTLLDAVCYRDCVTREKLRVLLVCSKCLFCNFNQVHCYII